MLSPIIQEFDDARDADDAVYDLNGKSLCGERYVMFLLGVCKLMYMCFEKHPSFIFWNIRQKLSDLANFGE